MQLVILAAGEGSRFKVVGYKEPKPLIKLFDKPLFWWAVESASQTCLVDSMLFVVQKKDDNEFNIKKIIQSYYPEANIILLDNLTRGASETAYFACSYLKKDLPVGFLDCDLFFSVKGDPKQNHFVSNKFSSALLTFQSKSPNYSYLDLKKNKIHGVYEKDVISDSAVAGFYLFKNVNFFQEVYQEVYLKYVKSNPSSEFYMSRLFDFMAKRGDYINIIKLIKHVSIGTPEELQIAEKLSFLRNYE